MKLVACYVRNMPSIRRDSLPKEFSNPKGKIDSIFGELLASYLDLDGMGIKIVETESFSVGLIHNVPQLSTVIGNGFVFVFEAD